MLANSRIAIEGEGSGIFSAVAEGVNQQGGGVLLSARSLTLRNEAEISVSNFGTGSAGAIFISALAVFLDNNSSISALTRSGEGGDIEFNVGILSLYNNSNISTTAGTAQAGGNGGNILVLGNSLLGLNRALIVAAKPTRNSNIIANAFTGAGGSISIIASRLQDIRRRAEVTATNDIDASSRFGATGTITVSLLDFDPERGTVPLATSLIDASRLIAEGCDTRGKLALGRLTNTGRGGIPPSPTDTFSEEESLAEWVVVDEARSERQEAEDTERGETRRRGSIENSVVSPQSSALSTQHSALSTQPFSPPLNPSSSEIVEAQGWILEGDGNVVLVAQAPAAEPQVPWLAPGACRLP